ncbi:hypothetical protein [Ochrobactrum sp. S1502_03]|uniref:hypothetical protein n=1 Tax=Ochrobactrum sp. S1502_03 TaxID=3108451 RepID=UPI0037C72AC9
MTSFVQEIETLKEAFERFQIALNNYPSDEAETEAIYNLFCQIGACFGPAISMHLRRLSARDAGDTVIWTGPGNDRADIIREINAEIVGQLLYDLAPAVGEAFHSGRDTVLSIVYDLVNGDPPIELPKPRKNKRGAGSRPYRQLKALARSDLHDIVIYEAEIRKLSAKEAFIQVLQTHDRPALGETYWRDLKREQREQRTDYSQSVNQIKADALRNGGSHPKRQQLNDPPFWKLLGS